MGSTRMALRAGIQQATSATSFSTNRVVTLKTDETGQFATKDLTVSKYDMVFKANGC